MRLKEHNINGIRIAEVESNELIIRSADDALDILGNIYYQGFDRLILHDKNIVPDFFDLKNGMAGEILQKFSNYRIRLAIVGDFSMHAGKSIQDFIRESNSLGYVNFIATLDKALTVLSK